MKKDKQKIKKIAPIKDETHREFMGQKNFYEEYLKRFIYIMEYCASIFGVRIDWFDWGDCFEESSQLTQDLFAGDDDDFVFQGRFYGDEESYFYNVDGDLQNIYENGCFPTRWFFEDFEQEVRAGFKEYLRSKEEKKTKEAKKNLASEKLDEIFAKLTKKEREFLTKNKDFIVENL